MIPYKYRFHGHSSLDYVYKNGQTSRSRIINIKSIINKKRNESRIAVVVGRKVIKSAVKRNLIRRRVYEYIRPKISQFTSPNDVVIIITSIEILSMSYKDIANQLDQLLGQAKIIN